MYSCPQCHAELPADARFCNVCGFNQTNARLAALTMPPTSSPQKRQPSQSPVSYAGIPQLDFTENISFPQQTPANSSQNLKTPAKHNSTPVLRDIADLPTTELQAYKSSEDNTYAVSQALTTPLPEPPTTPQPLNISTKLPEIVRTSTPPHGSHEHMHQSHSGTYLAKPPTSKQLYEREQANDTYRAGATDEQPALTQTGEVRLILKNAYKPQVPSVVYNDLQQRRTRTPWIILGVVFLLISGILAIAYFAIFAH